MGNAAGHTWKSEHNFHKLVLSHRVGPAEGTQDARPGGKSLYPLSHLYSGFENPVNLIV